MTGSLSVLNVGAGDIVVTFNQHDQDELAKAVKMLKDMQQRGYAILVRRPDNTYTRAIDIDGKTGSYVIIDDGVGGVEFDDEVQGVRDPAVQSGPEGPDPVIAAGSDPGQPEPPEPKTGLDDGPPVKGRRGRKRKVPIATSQAVGVARSAGG